VTASSEYGDISTSWAATRRAEADPGHFDLSVAASGLRNELAIAIRDVEAARRR